MVDRIGGRSGSLAHEAMMAALKKHARAAEEVRTQAAQSPSIASQTPSTGSTGGPDFAAAIKDGLAEVNAEVQRAEALPEELVTGEVGDLSEVAARLKTAELTFRFSMEIRNKLIDAYREVMRMQV